MAEQFLGEIRLVSFSSVPEGWAVCNGQVLPISGNQALFSLLGATFGGDGRTTFALPDFRGRVPIHADSAHRVGDSAGRAEVHLSDAQLPHHTHQVSATDRGGDTSSPAGNVLAEVNAAYGPASGDVTTLAPESVTVAGTGAGHENRMPYLVLNFVIATKGIFPSRP